MSNDVDLPKLRGIQLQTPRDVRRTVRRIVDRAFREGRELELSGRISQLLSVWIRAWEVEKIASFEERLKVLESIKEEIAHGQRRP
jgi:hypothetical protein